MRCRKQPKFLEKTGVRITNIWEVRIAPDIWQKVVQMASEYNLTYSWLIRYCVFRLACKKTLKMRPAMENLSRHIKSIQPVARECHRHMLCLYGEDEKLLRLAAMRLELTVSQLIRLALYWHISRFERDLMYRSFFRDHILLGEYYQIFSNTTVEGTHKQNLIRKFRKRVFGSYLIRRLDFRYVFWNGIKLSKSVSIQFDLYGQMPKEIFLSFRRFARLEWFAIRHHPPHEINLYFDDFLRLGSRESA